MAYAVSLLVLVGLLVVVARKYLQSRQLAFIDNYQFHRALRDRLGRKYPHLTAEQLQLVFAALRDFFWMCHKGRRKAVAMPSQAVDVAWHEFILFTRAYQHFCHKALGRLLHHTPAEAMTTPTLAQEGIRRAWRLACAREAIDPKSPQRLPRIFALDAMLGIADGFVYTLDCRGGKAQGHASGNCAGHIGCSAGCIGESGATQDSGGLLDASFGGGGGEGGGCGGD